VGRDVILQSVKLDLNRSEDRTRYFEHTAATDFLYTHLGALSDHELGLFVALGMPADAVRVRFLLRPPSLPEFRIDLFGAIVSDPEPFKSIGECLGIDLFRGDGLTDTVIIWRQCIRLEDTRAYIRAIWNPGLDPNMTTLLDGLGWRISSENVELGKRGVAARLEKGLELIDGMRAVVEKSKRIPRITKEQFLTEGLAAAERLARKPETKIKTLSPNSLAPEMGRDREAVKNASEFYPDAWVKIVERFTDTQTWLKTYGKG
jgi:hypothetical protein